MKLDLKKIKVAEKVSASREERVIFSIEGEEDLRKFLRDYRKKNKVTQEEIAVYSNLSRLAVSEFESGKADTRISSFFKLLKAYGLKMDLKD